jgi:hypothetical protein
MSRVVMIVHVGKEPLRLESCHRNKGVVEADH